MAVTLYKLPRVEGGCLVEQDENGAMRLVGAPPRGAEAELTGAGPLDAAYLTQRISADSGVTHALAAMLAVEQAAGQPIAHNGLLLRDLMHTLSLLHAHLRHFYFQALPDYFPPGEWENYEGAIPEVRALARGWKEKPKGAWNHFRFSHPFTKAHVARLTEHQARAVRVLAVLQRMIGAVGGKFPVVMSVIPGGVSTPLDEALVLRLRGYLAEVDWFLLEGPLADGLTVVEGFPDLVRQAPGGVDFLTAGSLGDEAGPDASLFPPGSLVEGALAPLQDAAAESVHNAFYRIPLKTGRGGAVLEPQPAKPGAYSWVKAPRYRGRPVEVGPLARLVVTGLSGSRSHTAEVAALLETRFQMPLAQANTTAGRMLARLAEIPPLVRWCRRILDDLKPGEPASAPPEKLSGLDGEGEGRLEGPAGMVWHRVVYERGRVGSYDIISPSTWNGGPRDQDNRVAGLELALNRQPPDLSTPVGHRTASRIVQSYCFSARDAVH